MLQLAYALLISEDNKDLFARLATDHRFGLPWKLLWNVVGKKVTGYMQKHFNTINEAEVAAVKLRVAAHFEVMSEKVRNRTGRFGCYQTH